MLRERGRDTEAKVKWPKRSIHVSPDKIGNYTLHMQGPKLVEIGPSAPTAGREMLKSHFFPRSERTACVHAAHKHTVCERESAIRGMFGLGISVFMVFEGICVHVCVSVPQFAAYTQTWPQDPVGNSLHVFSLNLIYFKHKHTYGHTDLKR